MSLKEVRAGGGSISSANASVRKKEVRGRMVGQGGRVEEMSPAGGQRGRRGGERWKSGEKKKVKRIQKEGKHKQREWREREREAQDKWQRLDSLTAHTVLETLITRECFSTLWLYYKRGEEKKKRKNNKSIVFCALAPSPGSSQPCILFADSAIMYSWGCSPCMWARRKDRATRLANQYANLSFGELRNVCCGCGPGLKLQTGGGMKGLEEGDGGVYRGGE